MRTRLIFDEVQTGVGRTGTFSISEQYHMEPDLISLAKSLGSGVPVGAVLVSDDIAATVASGDQGTTFGGGMIAMAAVEATLRTVAEEDLMAHSAELFLRIEDRLRPLVREVRRLSNRPRSRSQCSAHSEVAAAERCDHRQR